MNNQFKPGDLALALCGPFMGQVVELIRFVSPGEVVTSIDGKRSYVFTPALGVGGWHVAIGEESVIHHEKQLMPLRGDFQPERQQSREVPV